MYCRRLNQPHSLLELRPFPGRLQPSCMYGAAHLQGELPGRQGQQIQSDSGVDSSLVINSKKVSDRKANGSIASESSFHGLLGLADRQHQG